MYRYIIVCFIATMFYSTSEAHGTMVGGFTNWNYDGSDVQDIADAVEEKVEAECNCGKFPEFKVLKYKSQIVNGVNYEMEVQAGKDRKLMIKVYKPFNGEAQLKEMESIK